MVICFVQVAARFGCNRPCWGSIILFPLIRHVLAAASEPHNSKKAKQQVLSSKELAAWLSMKQTKMKLKMSVSPAARARVQGGYRHGVFIDQDPLPTPSGPCELLSNTRAVTPLLTFVRGSSHTHTLMDFSKGKGQEKEMNL